MGTMIKWSIVLCLVGLSLSIPQKRQSASTCMSTEFKCKNDDCISANLRCDGMANCVDGSDECGCPDVTPGPTTNPSSCTDSTYIPCNDGNGCYPPHWTCDSYDDCADKSDEMNCPATTSGPTPGPTTVSVCTADDIQCDDGNGCYPPNWKCDGIVDCKGDESDEANCPATTVGPSPTPVVCDATEIQCDDGYGCYPPSWKCDGIVDCNGDQSDEANCPATTVGPSPTPSYCSDTGYIICDDGNGCYPPNWKCDGIVDCKGDQSDEANCTGSTVGPTSGPTSGPTAGPSPSPGQCTNGDLQCADGNGCYPPVWKCDNWDDCDDKSDEANCPAPTTPAPPTPTCGQESSKCDGSEDCEDKSDEQGCDTYTCPAGMVKCGSSGDDVKLCVPDDAFCDGYQDCPDGGDELESICKARQCDSSEFRCSNGACLPQSVKCNGWPECQDGSDETGCSGCPNDALYQRCTDGKLCVEKSAFCDSIQDCADNSDESGCGVNPSKRGMLLRRFERLLNSFRSREKRSAMRHPMSVAQRALKAMHSAGRSKYHLTLAERRAHVRASVVRHPMNRRISRDRETLRRRSQIRHEKLRRRMYYRHISDEITKQRKEHMAEARRRHLKARRSG